MHPISGKGISGEGPGTPHVGGRVLHAFGEAMHPIAHFSMHLGFTGLTGMLQTILKSVANGSAAFFTALGFTFPLTATIAVLAFVRMRTRAGVLIYYLLAIGILIHPAIWLGTKLAIGSVAPGADAATAPIRTTTLHMLNGRDLTLATDVDRTTLGPTANRLAQGPLMTAWAGILLQSVVTYGWGNFFFSVAMGILMGIFASFTVDAAKRLRS